MVALINYDIEQDNPQERFSGISEDDAFSSVGTESNAEENDFDSSISSIASDGVCSEFEESAGTLHL